MTDSSKSPAIATPRLHPLLPPLRGVQNSRDTTNPVKFTDVLAKSKAPIVRREGGNASSEQMFEAGNQNTRDRKKTELRRDYRDGIERQSAARADGRTGVKSRRSSATQQEPAPEVLVPQSAKDVAIRNSAGVQQDSGRVAQSIAKPASSDKTPGKATAGPRFVEHERQGNGRVESSNKENQASIAPTTIQSRQVGSAPTPVASEPQAARELARLLASPTVMSGERDHASVPSLTAGRAGSLSTPEAKGTKDAGPSNDSPRSSTTQLKSEQSSNVSEFERLIRLVRSQPGRQSSTRVMLDPPELGRVHVRVIVDGDRVEVGVETENDTARQLISDRALKLKTTLEEHGLVIDRFNVSTNQTGLFEQRIIAGQETIRPRQDQHGSGTGRGYLARPRGTSGDGQAAAAVESVNAGWHSDMGLDIRV